MNLRIHNARGFTLIELFIALFMTGIIAAAGFQFYVSMHNSTVTQEDISDMQNTSRTSLQEMVRTVRMAGFKVGTHIPYRVNGDSLYVFYSDTQPVDTILFFLQEDPNGGMAEVEGVVARRLMKQVNSNAAGVYSDNVRAINYTVVDPSTIDITVQIQTARSDETFARHDGHRFLSMTGARDDPQPGYIDKKGQEL